MSKKQIPYLKIAAHTAAGLLVAWLIFDFYTGRLSINPIQDLTQRLGRYAIAFLAVTLACSPANNLFGVRQAIAVRRTLGLYAFGFAAAHFIFFAGVDYRFDIVTLVDETFTKPYIIVGLTTLLILTVLAVTSFDWWKKRLRKNWKRLHQLVYLAGVLVVVHYAWAVKGDLLRLSGEIARPLFYAVAIGLLLLARVPKVRQALSNRRNARLVKNTNPKQSFPLN